MLNKLRIFTLIVISAYAALLVNGCGSGSKEPGAKGSIAVPTEVGSETCTNNCHALTKDITGTSIATAWAATTHTTVQGVQCENCHGGASLHWGIGPMPYPAPQAARCLTCHDGSKAEDKTAFLDTTHGNSNLTPDKTFSQIATSADTGKHIEECSRCHNPNQKFVFDTAGNMVKPAIDDLQAPQVSCASCHDAHQPQAMTRVPQRTDPVFYPVFREFVVNSAGAQDSAGTEFVPVIFQANGVVEANGVIDATNVVNNNNELSVEKLCASCHTVGTYKNSGGATHQSDIYTQWTQSGHGDRFAAPFAEFSANPTFYIPGVDTSHKSSYPIDMAISKFVTAGPANTTQNAGNNNFKCFRCHNGLGSRAHQDDIQGTSEAPVIFGDEPVICITCHDAHTNVEGQSKNTRKPVVMTRYEETASSTAAALTFSGNVFLDNTPVPAETGNATICVFCHQGRESGFTLFKRRLASDGTMTGTFLNEHYLGTGAMLWGRNAYEYPGKLYGAVVEHQQTNCIGCHMAEGSRADVGGHTWKPVSDDDVVVNSATCNTAACHDGRVPTTNSSGEFDNFRDTVLDPVNDYDGNGIVEGIPVEIANLSIQLKDLLQANGVFYNDLKYPYFFTDGTFTTNFTAWTLPTHKAAFNLNFVIKGLPSQATTQVGEPNPSAAVHNFRYNIQLLRDSYDNLQANGVGGQADRSSQPRPSGTRDATNYDPQPGGGYNPRQ
ncbi:MAG: hypothetical protein HZB61_13925 [Nitrospirae bacterium]|nr:hypothetical protein [Nitrospirota bacterium]